MAHYASLCMPPCVLPRDGSSCFLGQATLMSRVQNEVVHRQMAVDQVPYPSSWREEKGVPGGNTKINDIMYYYYCILSFNQSSLTEGFLDISLLGS